MSDLGGGSRGLNTAAWPIVPDDDEQQHRDGVGLNADQGRATTAVKDAIEEPEFEPLGVIESRALAPFPIESMGVVGGFVASLAAHTQTPPDLAGVCVLGFMGGAVARKFVVDAGWREELALYLAPVAPPGMRKSEVFKQASEPMQEFEADLAASTVDEVRRNESKIELLKRRLSKIANRYADADDIGERNDLEKESIDVRRELAEVESGVTGAPRLMVADVTPEKLASVAAKNQERMTLASAEGGQIFDRMFRYSQNAEPNMDFVLSGHTGERCTIDRQGAPSLILRRPVLTIVGTVQPHVLESLSKNRAFEGRGLLARFAYAVPVDTRGYRNVRSSVEMDPKASSTYRSVLRQMLELPHDFDVPRVLRVEGAARSDFQDLHAWVEEGQRDGGEFEEVRSWASKAHGLVLRIAGVLAIAENPRSPEITLEVMRRAIALGVYFADHSRRAFEIMAGRTGDPVVDKLWNWITRRGEPGTDFTRQDIWQGVKGGRLRLAEDLDGPLARLRVAGRIARRAVARHVGRPPEVWAVNPQAIP